MGTAFAWAFPILSRKPCQVTEVSCCRDLTVCRSDLNLEFMTPVNDPGPDRRDGNARSEVIVPISLIVYMTRWRIAKKPDVSPCRPYRGCGVIPRDAERVAAANAACALGTRLRHRTTVSSQRANSPEETFIAFRFQCGTAS